MDTVQPREFTDHFVASRAIDAAFDKEVSCFRVAGFDIRVVYAPVGELDDYDDVRVFERAVGKAMARAVKVSCFSIWLQDIQIFA